MDSLELEKRIATGIATVTLKLIEVGLPESDLAMVVNRLVDGAIIALLAQIPDADKADVLAECDRLQSKLFSLLYEMGIICASTDEQKFATER